MKASVKVSGALHCYAWSHSAIISDVPKTSLAADFMAAWVFIYMLMVLWCKNSKMLIYLRKREKKPVEVHNTTSFPLPVQTNMTWPTPGQPVHKVMATCCQRFLKAVRLSWYQMMKRISFVAFGSLISTVSIRVNAQWRVTNCKRTPSIMAHQHTYIQSYERLRVNVCVSISGLAKCVINSAKQIS